MESKMSDVIEFAKILQRKIQGQVGPNRSLVEIALDAAIVEYESTRGREHADEPSRIAGTVTPADAVTPTAKAGVAGSHPAPSTLDELRASYWNHRAGVPPETGRDSLGFADADALIAALEAENARLRRLMVHCENCGADYAATGIEAGCPCAWRERAEAAERERDEAILATQRERSGRLEAEARARDLEKERAEYYGNACHNGNVALAAEAKFARLREPLTDEECGQIWLGCPRVPEHQAGRGGGQVSALDELRPKDMTSKARNDCASWLAMCVRLGWPKSALDDLESLWWRYHDNTGAERAILEAQPAPQVTRAQLRKGVVAGLMQRMTMQQASDYADDIMRTLEALGCVKFKEE